MPKIIELTLEVKIEKVSCPGVWLCQCGHVSLTMFALGTGFQTCFLPPMFPLLFKDVFYFQKKFQATCAVNNIACMLKDESIYCELVQWNEDCKANECIILAQYLGSLADVLFPPNVCSLDGVDLLMRRTDIFPGILAPKIEISTKVRIDEVWEKLEHSLKTTKPCTKGMDCKCKPKPIGRTRPVCHSINYRLTPCNRPRSHSSEVTQECFTVHGLKRCPTSKSRTSQSCSPTRSHTTPLIYNTYNTSAPPRCLLNKDKRKTSPNRSFDEKEEAATDMSLNDDELVTALEDQSNNKLTLESNFIEHDTALHDVLNDNMKDRAWRTVTPCECEICKRYHELFHCEKPK